jgi:pyridoxal phosphate enzyme (YggS family)
LKFSDNYQRIKSHIFDCAVAAGRTPSDIQLLAVSKGQSAVAMRELYSAGCRNFGESRVQEATAKLEELAGCTGISLDFIGRLQTNKVAQVVGRFRLIHSVDRLSLAQAIQHAMQEGVAQNMVQDILLQVSLAGEVQKGGVSPDTLPELIDRVVNMPNLRLCGFMTMPPYDDEPEASRAYFHQLYSLFEQYRRDVPSMKELSMGMSGDYHVAIAEGATIVRVGTALFE